MRINAFVTTLIVILVVAAGVLANAATLGNAFTYQGKLTDSTGIPLSGSHNMTFKLFDAVSSGNQVGSTVTASGTQVTGGLFTVQLDFGAGVFNGQRRWLEATVDSQTLTPRVEIASTPNAIYAQSVPWSGITGVPSLGTVTSVATGDGLTGGPITSNGTISIANSGVTTNMLADGAVTSSKLAPGALANYAGDIQNLLDSNVNPTIVGFVATEDYPSCVAVSGRYAYVIDYSTNNFKVIDVNNPASPTVVGSVATNGSIVHMTVAGRYAYAVGNYTSKNSL